MVISITCQSQHHILDADNMFSRFTDPKMKINFAPGQTMPGVSLISDLGERAFLLDS